ncbi:nicastrin [Toxorhynchites rutilus septentrionalis]|uniref:nicastrin n=1 Tax=Toxorhynchites rutilus septentrionalis TaxID=329112 RepID=UPI00247AD441|nr:nicastrin [Toxorhynchites rutilus septentrionalis]
METQGVLSVLLFVVLISLDNAVHSQRIKDDMYTPISGAHCFRRMNGTHVTGCSSKLGGSVGVLHFITAAEDIDFIIEHHPAPPYAPVIPPHLFTRDNIMRLRDSGGEHVSAIILINNATELDQCSQESRCPNQFSGLIAGDDEEGCSVDQPDKSWNPWGTGLLLEDFPFPVYYVAEPEEIGKLFDCFEKFNNYDLKNQHTRSLCSIQINAFMSAAVNSKVCLGRSTLFNSLSPMKFCDPLQGKNVFATLFPRVHVQPENRRVDLSERIILVSTRMDTTTMFDGIGLGAMDSLVPFTILVSISHFLAKVLPERIRSSDPNVLFMFFNGESYDYIGSQRFVYDLQEGAFPTKGGMTNPVALENIDLMIDIGTIDDLNNLRIYHASDIAAVPQISKIIERVNLSNRLNIKAEAPIKTRNLPPVSSQSFLRFNASFPSVIVTSAPANHFYHSIYDDNENLKFVYGNHSGEQDFTQLENIAQKNEFFAEDSVQIRLRNVSSLLGMVIYELVTGTRYDPKFGTNSVLIDEFLYCFLHSADCPLFHAAAKPDSPKPFPAPPTRYISVHSTLPSEASGWTHRILGLLVGQKVNTSTKTDCQALHLPYNWYAGYYGLGECHLTTQNFTQALSPAFLDDDYDFASTRYSTWTESTWREMSARIFLRPSMSHESFTLSIGFVVMVISFVLVFLINSRSEVLFNQCASTKPIASPTQC